jgi:hypothetical protein
MGIKLFDPPSGKDFWERVPWGKLFVALVYASAAGLAILSVLRSGHGL